jgi:hypothetical protein
VRQVAYLQGLYRDARSTEHKIPKYLCPELLEIHSTKIHLFVTARYFPFNLFAWVLAKNCPRTQLGLASRPHPWSGINSCPIDGGRKLQMMLLFTGAQTDDKVTTATKNRPNPSARHFHTLYNKNNNNNNNNEVRTVPIYCTLQLKRDGTRWRTGGKVKGETGEWSG